MQSPYIKLFTKLRGHFLYPRDRSFTEYEAWLDLLIHAHPTGQTNFNECAARWQWGATQLNDFRRNLIQQGLIKLEADYLTATISNYDKWIGTHESKAAQAAGEGEEKSSQKEDFCREVITAFNEVFDKRIIYTRERATQIWARRKGGTKANPIVVESFRNMFVHMKERWENDENMKSHLSIETLTRAKHFQKYLEWAREAAAKKVKAGAEKNLIFKPTVID